MTQVEQTKMRAMTLRESADAFELCEQTLPLPTIQSGQVLIKVHYCGLNPVDTKLARSGHPSWQYPHIPGVDGVGTVVQGDQHHHALVGKQVMWHGDLTRHGSLAEYVCIDAHGLSIIPDGVALQNAACLPCAGMTALSALCRMKLSEGESLLIEGGAGAVGQFAIQLARQRGIRVFATASKARQQLLNKLGVEQSFDYGANNVEEQVALAKGHNGFDAALDCVGSEVTARALRHLRFGGKLACLNGLSGAQPDELFKHSPIVYFISLGGAWLSGDLCAQQQLSLKGNHLLMLLQQASLSLPEIIEVPFDAQPVTQAMHLQLDGHIRGKQIVTVSPMTVSEARQ